MIDSLEKIQHDIIIAKLRLHEHAKNLVLGKGNPRAEILFIGEAPGAKEDELGIPFIGAAGRELNKLLKGIDMRLDDCYIANILKYRPPKNRDPKMTEIMEHTPYLVRQIQVIKPKIILTLGKFATSFVLSEFQPEKMKKVPIISQIHGKEKKINVKDKTYLVIPMYHPAACLYKPTLREVLIKDFKHAKNVLDNLKKEGI